MRDNLKQFAEQSKLLPKLLSLQAYLQKNNKKSKKMIANTFVILYHVKRF